MMSESELKRFVRDEIKNQINIILHGSAGENTEQVETIDNMFPGMPSITKRPVMHPFGLVSRAMKGTISVIAKVGNDIQNRMVLGHRDKGRPTDLEEGEVVLYNAFGQAIYLRKGKVLYGSKASASPAVLGDVLLNAMTDILNAILQAPQIGQCAVGPVVLEPSVRQKLMTAKMKYVDDASTNVVSQLVFTERGGG